MNEKQINVKTGGSEKVTNIVGTFLNEDRDDLRKISVATTQLASEKVTCPVGTFLKVKSEKVTNTQIELEKVTNLGGTFLNEERDGFRIISVNNCFGEILNQFWQVNLCEKNHLKHNKEYSEKPDFNILFAPISAKAIF